ncbi:hypothetical protein CYMTET_39447 [Cymbomonas tetramitiformis]|uniref:B30.2/SPRY domain-containing protein n=1 Tax=Cymbomonas tetramitiformis TaxID=36881 RepID=A0AAE0CA26_9CHLO|nr:hypothetical protein CYMTET_39447 [Cymbomonas tetramitiformis]
MAYIRREAEVTGDGVTLNFKLEHMNHVLKTLNVRFDENTTCNKGITYTPTCSLSYKLDQLGVHLPSGVSNFTLPTLLTQMTGTKESSNAKSAFSEHKLHLCCEASSGETYLASCSLNNARRIFLCESSVYTDLIEVLNAFNEALCKSGKSLHVPLCRADGHTTSRVSVAYMHPCPSWKFSYRINLMQQGRSVLQGWALIDNISDQDWKDVQVELVSGSPYVITADLYSPTFGEVPHSAGGLRDPLAHAHLFGHGQLATEMADKHRVRQAQIHTSGMEQRGMGGFGVPERGPDFHDNSFRSAPPEAPGFPGRMTTAAAFATGCSSAAFGAPTAFGHHFPSPSSFQLSAAGSASAFGGFGASAPQMFGASPAPFGASPAPAFGAAAGAEPFGALVGDAMPATPSGRALFGGSMFGSGVAGETTSTETETLFNLKIPQAISVARNQSVTMPVLEDCAIDCQRVVYVNTMETRPGIPKCAESAVFLRNNSGVMLCPGAVVVMDVTGDGAHAGNSFDQVGSPGTLLRKVWEGELWMEQVNPNETVLMPFGRESTFQVAINFEKPADSLSAVTLQGSRGLHQMVRLKRAIAHRQVLKLKNMGAHDRVCIVEHVLTPGRELSRKTTRSLLSRFHNSQGRIVARFKLHAPAKKVTLFTIEDVQIKRSVEPFSAVDVHNKLEIMKWIDEPCRAQIVAIKAKQAEKERVIALGNQQTMLQSGFQKEHQALLKKIEEAAATAEMAPLRAKWSEEVMAVEAKLKEVKDEVDQLHKDLKAAAKEEETLLSQLQYHATCPVQTQPSHQEPQPPGSHDEDQGNLQAVPYLFETAATLLGQPAAKAMRVPTSVDMQSVPRRCNVDLQALKLDYDAQLDAPTALESSDEWEEVDGASELGASDGPPAITCRGDAGITFTEDGAYYFEVKVVSTGDDDCVAIGFVTEAQAQACDGIMPVPAQVGPEESCFKSCRFVSDSGRIYSGNVPLGSDVQQDTFGAGDVVGCGFYRGKIFFTKNGEYVDCYSPEFVILDEYLFPAIGMKSPGSSLIVNFGSRAFEFDMAGRINMSLMAQSQACRRLTRRPRK